MLSNPTALIESFIQFVQTNLVPYGAAGIFAAAFLEEVVAPIPSAAVMMASGFFFLSGGWSAAVAGRLLFGVALPIALGVTAGSLVIYGLVYAFGKPALIKWGKWFGVSWEDVEQAERRFSRTKRDELLILAFRIIPVIPSVVIASFCGLVRVDVRKYAVLTFVGTFVRAVILAIAGWQLGNVYEEYARAINQVEDAVLYTIAAAAIVAVLARAYVFMSKRK